MPTLVEFPRSNLSINKAIADQTYLLDVFVEGHELLNRASKLVADDIVRSTPELRAVLGAAADWMRLFQQSIDQLEQEIKNAAA